MYYCYAFVYIYIYIGINIHIHIISYTGMCLHTNIYMCRHPEPCAKGSVSRSNAAQPTWCTERGQELEHIRRVVGSGFREKSLQCRDLGHVALPSTFRGQSQPVLVHPYILVLKDAAEPLNKDLQPCCLKTTAACPHSYTVDPKAPGALPPTPPPKKKKNKTQLCKS